MIEREKCQRTEKLVSDTSIFKRGEKKYVPDNRLIRLTLIPREIMETINLGKLRCILEYKNIEI